jgi:uncharacterized protein YkwD
MLRYARILLTALLVAGALLVHARGAAGSRPRVHIDRVEKHVVDILNAVRRHYRLSRLGLSRRLSFGATLHSAQMARTRTLTHGNWFPRVASAARTGDVGEVVGLLRGSGGNAQAHWIVRAWMASPPHRSVLLRGDFRRLGVSRRNGGGMTFFTVDVAR